MKGRELQLYVGVRYAVGHRFENNEKFEILIKWQW